jgi:hypothetical protein
VVSGIDSFRERFKNYTDCYTIIGGTACDILLTEAELTFRATKDIDIILIMEAKFPEFASIFWEYIKEGDYRCGWKNSEDMHFYRFTEGTRVETAGLVTESIRRYIEEIDAVDESEVRLIQMGLPFDRNQGVELLKEIYL